jgi:hypothetical protein
VSSVCRARLPGELASPPLSDFLWASRGQWGNITRNLSSYRRLAFACRDLRGFAVSNMATGAHRTRTGGKIWVLELGGTHIRHQLPGEGVRTLFGLP